MHKIERELRKIYRYSKLNYVFDVYIECEYRANLTKVEYEGLQPGEFRFDYKSWENRLGYSHKQMIRAIKELTIKNMVIIQTFKGVKGNCSKYYLARFEEQKQKQNDEQKQEQNKVSSFNGFNNTEEQNKEQIEEQKAVHSSRYNHLDIKSNTIYTTIFDYWISKNIKKHRTITNDMKKAIDKTLKEYSQDQILESINNYALMFNDKNYKWCDYQWGLNEFLLRKDKDGIRQLELFLNEGSKYINYLKSKQHVQKQAASREFNFEDD